MSVKMMGGLWFNQTPAFSIGDYVAKKSGSSWRGKVVGFYRTKLTSIGYVVESYFEENSVQNYPEVALEPWARPARDDER